MPALIAFHAVAGLLLSPSTAWRIGLLSELSLTLLIKLSMMQI